MAKGQPQMVKPSDFMPLVDKQAEYNRGNVTANGIGSRTTDLTGNSTFNFNPDLTNTDALSKAMYDKQMALLRPTWTQQQRTLEQSLANRGLPSTSEAYGTEMGNFMRNRNSAMDMAANQAVIGGEAARSNRMAQAMQLLGYNPTPVDISGPAQIAQSANNAQTQAQANAKGGATDLLGTGIMAAAL